MGDVGLIAAAAGRTIVREPGGGATDPVMAGVPAAAERMRFDVAATAFAHLAIVGYLVLVNQRTLAQLVSDRIGFSRGSNYPGAIVRWFRLAYPGNPLRSAFYSLVPCYLLAICPFLLPARAPGKSARPVAPAYKVR